MVNLKDYKLQSINDYKKTYKDRIKIERKEKNQKNLSIFRDDMFKTETANIKM